MSILCLVCWCPEPPDLQISSYIFKWCYTDNTKTFMLYWMASPSDWFLVLNKVFLPSQKKSEKFRRGFLFVNICVWRLYGYNLKSVISTFELSLGVENREINEAKLEKFPHLSFLKYMFRQKFLVLKFLGFTTPEIFSYTCINVWMFMRTVIFLILIHLIGKLLITIQLVYYCNIIWILWYAISDKRYHVHVREKIYDGEQRYGPNFTRHCHYVIA